MYSNHTRSYEQKAEGIKKYDQNFCLQMDILGYQFSIWKSNFTFKKFGIVSLHSQNRLVSRWAENNFISKIYIGKPEVQTICSNASQALLTLEKKIYSRLVVVKPSFETFEQKTYAVHVLCIVLRYHCVTYCVASENVPPLRLSRHYGSFQ